MAGVVALLLLCCAAVQGLSPAKLMIVSFDGFRYNYVNASSTPNLMALRSRGTHSQYMVNVFPTKTFPNHHSIATGLYVEDHGVLGSRLSDNGTTIGYSQQMFRYNTSVLPIWILNQRAGRHSGSMMWLGGEFSYNNTVATFHRVLDPDASWQEKIDTALQWFQNESTPANVVMVYFNQPDFESHRCGGDSENSRRQISRVDDIVSYIEKALTQRHLDDVNVFLLSDHGMVDVRFEHVLDITSEKNKALNDVKQRYSMIGSSPVLQVRPVQGSEEEIYQTFYNLSVVKGGFKVYRRSDIPASWHVTNFSRMSELLLVADLGYSFQDILKFKFGPGQVVGLHGYDNRHLEMRPFFQAFGPDIKRGHRIKPFQNVDLYSLWCHLLGLEDVQSKGNFENVKEMLINGSSSSSKNALFAVFLVALLVVI